MAWPHHGAPHHHHFPWCNTTIYYVPVHCTTLIPTIVVHYRAPAPVQAVEVESLPSVPNNHTVRVLLVSLVPLDPQVLHHIRVDEEVGAEVVLPDEGGHGQGGGQDVLLSHREPQPATQKELLFQNQTFKEKFYLLGQFSMQGRPSRL